jgi:hypothetical protein
MPIDIACHCGARFRARDDLAGRRVPCPRCKQPLAIPRAQSQSLAPLQNDPFHSTIPAATTLASLATTAPTVSSPDATLPPSAPAFGFDLARGKSNLHVAIGTLISCVTFLLGLVLAFVFVVGFQRASQSAYWRPALATVTECTVIRTVSLKNGVRYRLQFAYEYSVDGQFFTGRDVTLGGHFGSDVRQVARKYPAGSTPTAFYDPADPKVAVLERGVGPSTWGILALTILFLVGGCLGLVVFGLTLINRTS